MTARISLFRLAGAIPEAELAAVRACMERVGRGEIAGAAVIAQLAGRTLSLGRYQLASDTSGVEIVRRLTGGVETRYGDGILSLSLVAPDPWSWLREAGTRRGDRLLNRYVRALLPGLAKLGLRAVYPGRDFVTVSRRRVAYLTADRSPDGVFLFQAIIGADRPYACDGSARAAPAGLPPLPASSSLGAELASPSSCLVATEQALLASSASYFGFEWVEQRGVAAPAPRTPVEPRSPRGPSASSLRGPVEIPIGRLYARVASTPQGDLSRVQFYGDWIAGSGDVGELEAALAGVARGKIADLVRRWFDTPERLAIGLASPEPVIALLCGTDPAPVPSG